MYMTFEGVIANRVRPTGTGTAPTVIVRNFIDLWPNQTCASSVKAPSLLRTSWRITVLYGLRLPVAARRSEPLLLLERDSTRIQYSATIGCNGVGGTVTVTGDQIDFGPGTGTLRSCGDPLDALEARLRDVLDRATRWEIFGNTLRLMNDAGATVALLEARR
jgi:putative lipoprotein